MHKLRAMKLTNKNEPPRHADRLTTPEAAAYLRISASKLTKDRAAGKGPRYVRLGTKILYRATDLDQYVAASIIETTDSHKIGASNPPPLHSEIKRS